MSTTPDAPTFENTIVALEKTGELLDKVTNVFFNLLSAETTDFLDELAQKMSPILTEHSNNITLNEKLFQRVKAVYDDHAAEEFARLNPEQKMLLTNSYEGFVRHGANLSKTKKEQHRTHLSRTGCALSAVLTEQTERHERLSFFILPMKQTLEGLPDSAIDLARQTAKEKEHGRICVHASSSFLHPLPHLLCPTRTKATRCTWHTTHYARMQTATTMSLLSTR